jgi:hypothetical protein
MSIQTTIFDDLIASQNFTTHRELAGIRFALTIHQPWAWLITHGFMDVENRNWETHHRGFFFVHAGSRADGAAFEWVHSAFPDVFEKMPRRGSHEYLLGHIIGIANIYSCIPHSGKLSDWHFGRFGFYLSHQKPITPIKCKGRLGFFQPDIHNINKIEGYQL